jgi:hypothetical protein
MANPIEHAGKLYLASLAESSALSKLDILVLIALLANTRSVVPQLQHKAASILLTAACLDFFTLADLLQCISEAHQQSMPLLNSWPEMQRLCNLFAWGCWRSPASRLMHLPTLNKSSVVVLQRSSSAVDATVTPPTTTTTSSSSSSGRKDYRSKSQSKRRTTTRTRPMPLWATRLWQQAFELHECWRADIISSLVAECSCASDTLHQSPQQVGRSIRTPGIVHLLAVQHSLTDWLTLIAFVGSEWCITGTA